MKGKRCREEKKMSQLDTRTKGVVGKIHAKDEIIGSGEQDSLNRQGRGGREKILSRERGYGLFANE